MARTEDPTMGVVYGDAGPFNPFDDSNFKNSYDGANDFYPNVSEAEMQLIRKGFFEELLRKEAETQKLLQNQQ